MGTHSESDRGRRHDGIIRNVMHLGAGQVATTTLTIMLTAVIARTLGATDFGLLYFIGSISTFAYVFVDWGHGPYIIREVARHPDRSGELLGSALVVRTLTSLIVCVLAVIGAHLLGYDDRTRTLTAVRILSLVPCYLGLSFTWVFRGRERMDYDALLNTVFKLGNLVFSVLCLMAGGRLLALLLATSLAGVVTCVIALVVYKRMHLSPIRATVRTARELAQDGAPMMAMSLAVAVQPYLDANILYRFAPAGVMGWYGAAWNIGGTLVAPAMILGATMYPRLSRAAGDLHQFRRVLRAAFRPLLFLAVLGGVGTYLFADVAIALIYSKQKFGPAGSILKALAPALVLLYMDMLFGHAILAAGKAGRLAVAKIGAVVVTTALEFILIPYCQARYGNGGLGVVLAMGAGEFVMVCAVVVLIREAVDRGMLFDVGRALASGAATVLVLRSLPSITPFVEIPLCVLLFLGCAVVTGLVGRQDFELLGSALTRRAPAAPATVPVGGGDVISPALSAPVDPPSDRAR
jgi:O-antigen/teichoic acid export membrane protein